MGIFVCDRCHGFENTAYGTYHNRDSMSMLYEGCKDGEALCTACLPVTYLSGRSTRFSGVWHNRFPRKLATFESINGRELVPTKGLREVEQGLVPKVTGVFVSIDRDPFPSLIG